MMEIVGRYMLTERLAQGGTAEVFRARAHGVEGFRKAVAIKRLRRDIASDAEAEERFAKQSSLALSLQHANIVQAFDFGSTPGEGNGPARHYLVMELVEGVTLAELLAYYRATRSRMPVSVAAFVGAEIARALDYAHRRTAESGALLGLVHRDLAPANVMLSVEGEVKVTDFGADPSSVPPPSLGAERTEHDLTLATVAGTSAYMSPEQARGETLDAASDVYSLGTIVYECLTGSNPFADNNPAETQRRVRASEVPPPELLYPEAPEGVLAVLRSAMASDPSARTQRAGQLADELTWLCFEDAECSPSVALGTIVQACIRWRSEPPPSARVETPTNPPPPSLPAPSERVSARRAHASVVVVSLSHGDFEGADRASLALERVGAHLAMREPPRVVAVLVHDEGAGDELERAVRGAWWVASEGNDDTARVGVATGVLTLDLDGTPRDGDDLAQLARDAENAVPVGMSGVFLDQSMASGVRHAFRVEELEDAAQVFRVSEAYGLSGRMGPFCGHRTELRALWESLSRASKGGTELLHVKGPAGIGKTRLLLEHAARASARLPDLRVEVTPCPKDGALPYSTIASLIEGWSRGNLGALAQRLARAGLTTQDIDAALRAFEPLEPTSLVAVPTKEAVVRFVAALLAEARMGGPLLLAFDDADEMDAASAQVLADVFGDAEDLRASIVFVSRHALQAPLLALDARRVDVFELDRDPSDRLALGLWEATAAPRELLDYVWDSSRGQPRLMECLATSLREGGHVRVERNKAIIAEPLHTAPIPLPVRMYFLSSYEQLKPLRMDIVDVVGMLGKLATRRRVTAVLRVLGRDDTDNDISRSFGILSHRGLLADTEPSALSLGLMPDWGAALGSARRRALVSAAMVVCEADTELGQASEWLMVGELAESAGELEAASRAFSRAIQLAEECADSVHVARAAAASARVLRDDNYKPCAHASFVQTWCAHSRALSAVQVGHDAAALIRTLDRMPSPEEKAQFAMAIARALRGRDADAERAQALTFALAVAGHHTELRAQVEAETATQTHTPPPASVGP